MAQSCLLVAVVVLLVVSLGLTITALMTNYWYCASTGGNVNPEIQKNYNFHYGLWNLCYDMGLPADVASDSSLEKDGSCVHIYHQLIEKDEGTFDYDHRLRLHMSRAVLGCCITAAVLMVAALLTLLCGTCPCGCDPVKKTGLYRVILLMLIVCAIAGMASGICFIALRDLDNTTVRTQSGMPSTSGGLLRMMPPAVPEYVAQSYCWSFMLHFIATGLVLLNCVLVCCMLHNNYEFVNDDSKFSPYSSM